MEIINLGDYGRVQLPETGAIASAEQLEYYIAGIPSYYLGLELREDRKERLLGWQRRIEEAMPLRKDDEITLKLKESSDSLEALRIIWGKERGEWVGFYLSSWNESSATGWKYTCRGPFSLNAKYAAKIGKAFGIQAAGLDWILTTDVNELKAASNETK